MCSPRQQFLLLVTLALFIGISAFSCKNKKSKLSEYGATVESVLFSDLATFRGFNFGDSKSFIQSKEIGRPVQVSKDYLYYEYKLISNGSYNIAYSFDEVGLNEIHTDIYINNAGEKEDVFIEFKTYFDHHFGDSQSQNGFNVWSAKSYKYGEVLITIRSESADFSADNLPEKISLWIYPNKS